MAVYNIDYYGMGLNLIEHFCEGEFVLANRLKFKRYYKMCYGDLPIHLTEVYDTTQQNYLKGSIVLVHGFAQCSDAFIETAL